MQVFVKASRRAKAYVRGSRSKLAATANRWKEPKIKTLKSNAYNRYKTAMYTRGVSASRRNHLFNRLRKLERALERHFSSGRQRSSRY